MKHFCLLLALCLLASPAFGADTPISGLPSGGVVQPQDEVPIYNPSFPGQNFEVDFGTLAGVNPGPDFTVIGGTLFLGLGTETGALQLPIGTTGQRPTASSGMIRYNSTVPQLEAYVNGSWVALGGGSSFSLTAGNAGIVLGSSPFTGGANTISLGTPTTTTLGGLLALASSTAHQVLQYIDTSGAQHLIQLAVSDITGAAPLASPTFTGTVTLPAGQSVNGVTLQSSGSSSLYLTQAGTYAAASGGGSMVYPGAGIPNSTGSAWGTSYAVTGTGNVVLSASPTLTGTITAAAANFSGTVGIGTSSPTDSLDLSQKTDAMTLPSGTTGQRPASPVAGMIRYNSTTPNAEVYQNSQWNAVAGIPATTQANPQTAQLLYTGANSAWIPQNTYALNLDPIYLTHLSKCIAKVKNNQGNCRVILLGDSTTVGAYSNGGNTANIGFAAPAPILAQAFIAAGIPATNDAWWGGGYPIGTIALDGRVTVGSGWSADTGGSFTIGGYDMEASSATSSLSFKPTHPFDTCKIWYLQTPTSGTLSANIGSGSTTTQSTTNASYGLGSVTITGSKSINTCNVNWSSGSFVHVIGMETWDSSKSVVIFEEAGAGGSTSTNWTSNTTNSWGVAAGGLTTIAPDAAWINLDINEWVNSIGVSTHTTNIQTLITNTQAAGADVFLVTGVPSDPVASGISLATQQPYINADYALSQSNKIPLIDVNSLFQSYAVGNPLSLYGNAYHPSQLGYQKYANLVASDLLQATATGSGSNPVEFTSNANGPPIDIYANPSTGTGTSGFNFWTYAAGSSGSSQNYPSLALSMNGANVAIPGNLTVTGTCTGCSSGGSGGVGAVLPSSIYTTDAGGNLFPNVYAGAGGNSSVHDAGWGVAASLGSDVTLELRFQMPSTIPSGTFKLASYCLANYTGSNSALYTISDADVAAGASPSAATLTAETQTSISSWTADQYVVTKTPLTHSTPSADHVSVVAVTFNHTGWTLTQPLTCRWVEIWE